MQTEETGTESRKELHLLPVTVKEYDPRLPFSLLALVVLKSKLCQITTEMVTKGS